jgi:hypothetical protein
VHQALPTEARKLAEGAEPLELGHFCAMQAVELWQRTEAAAAAAAAAAAFPLPARLRALAGLVPWLAAVEAVPTPPAAAASR